MSATLLLGFLGTLIQISPIEVSIATLPPDSRNELMLVPDGEVEVRREDTLTRVKVEIRDLSPFDALQPELRAWIVWAVSPEGDFENLGELEPDGREAELETVTSLGQFGILITAEPHFRVESPSAAVAFRSQSARNRNIRIQPQTVEVGRYDYSGISLPPQGGVHRRITQARAAVAFAENAMTNDGAQSALRPARVALDSMEQLLGRQTPLEVVLPYANDSVRLSDLALREARVAEEQTRLAEANARIRNLEGALSDAEQDRDRLDTRERDAVARIGELLGEMEQVREELRSLTIDRDTAQRDLRNARAEIQTLQDPWAPLMMAMVFEFGARETPRGLVLQLPGGAFEDEEEGILTPQSREWLSRLQGTLLFGEVPELWIEGRGTDPEGLLRAGAQASAVRDYLIEGGLPAARIQSRARGAIAPVPRPDEVVSDAAVGTIGTIEIIIREPGAL